MEQQRASEAARVEFRMPSNLKAEVEDAAALLGATFTSFAIECLVAKAREVKMDYNAIVLNDSDRDRFLQALTGPAAPSDPLVRLMNAKAP